MKKPYFSTTENPNGAAGTATLEFPPTQVSGETHSKPIRAIANTRFFVAVEYPAHIFNTYAAAVQAFAYLKGLGVRRVYLIGPSVGTDVVTEFIRYNAMQGEDALEIIGVILADPAWGAGELFDTRTPILRWLWWPGAVVNLGTKQFWEAGFDPPTPEPEVDEDILAEHHTRSKAYKLSSWGGQVRTAASPSDARPGEFAAIPMMLLRSKHDKVVKNTAIPRWLAVYGVDDSHVFYVDSAHCDFPAFPKAWQGAFSWAFAKLPQPQFGHVRSPP